MFYQIFLSSQLKGCGIITYKHGIFELPHELPNYLRLRILENQDISGKCLNFIECSLVPFLPAKMKNFLMLAENSWKTEIKLFPLCAISQEN